MEKIKMKNFYIIKPLLIFSALVLFCGMGPRNLMQVYAGDKAKPTTDVSTTNEVKKETAEAVEAIKKYAVAQKDEALVKAEKYMNKLDNRIDKWESQLDANWDQMSESARLKWRASIKNLQKQRNNLSEWYGGMKHSSGEAWDEIKKGFSEAYTAVADSLEKASKEFKADKK